MAVSSSATIKEIALRADVSVATVSRVINNHPSVRSTVRERVLKVIDEIGYEPDPIARSLRTQATNTIGFIVRDLIDPVFSTMAQGVDDVLRAEGFTLLLSTSSHDPIRDAAQLAMLRSRRVDGVMLAISDESSPELIKEIRRTNRPIMLLDREVEGATADAVVTDYRSGMRDAIDYLASLGHRRIGYIGGSLAIRPGRERLRGFSSALREAGLDADADLVRSGSFSQSDGATMTHELLDLPIPPTAIIAAGNQITVGALQALRARHIALPHDLSLIGLDDVDLFRYGNPPITVISRSFERIGQLAAKRILERIRTPEENAYEQIFVPTSLIVRESCRAIST